MRRSFPPLLVTIKLPRACARAIAGLLEDAMAAVFAIPKGNRPSEATAQMIDTICEVAVASRPDQRHVCSFTFASGTKFDARHRTRDEARMLREAIKLALTFEERHGERVKPYLSKPTRRTLRARLGLLDDLLETPVVDRLAALDEPKGCDFGQFVIVCGNRIHCPGSTLPASMQSPYWKAKR